MREGIAAATERLTYSVSVERKRTVGSDDVAAAAEKEAVMTREMHSGEEK